MSRSHFEVLHNPKKQSDGHGANSSLKELTTTEKGCKKKRDAFSESISVNVILLITGILEVDDPLHFRL